MRELQLRNLQRERRINIDALRRLLFALLEEDLGLANFQLGVHLVDARKMAALNEQFMGHTGSTDVISFDYQEGYSETASENLDLAGEIYISVPDAVAQAREFSTNWQEEIVRYSVHGVLHLHGYDDLSPSARRLMKREENRLLRRLSQRFSLAGIAA